VAVLGDWRRGRPGRAAGVRVRLGSEEDKADYWVCFLIADHPGRHSDGEKRWRDEEAPLGVRATLVP
jgi:hypothetical protein